MKRQNTQQSVSPRSPSRAPQLSLAISPKRAATRRVFSVMELLLMIFETFNLLEKEHCSSLLSAMLTCKHWYKHACVVMWRVATCTKLLCLMPSFIPDADVCVISFLQAALSEINTAIYLGKDVLDRT